MFIFTEFGEAEWSMDNRLVIVINSKLTIVQQLQM